MIKQYEEYIHFDSINSTKTNNDSFNSLFQLPRTYQKLKYIYLKNVELPLCFPNIRASNLSNNLQFSINSNNYSTTLTEKNYISINTLLTDLNAAIVTTLTASGFTMVLSIGINNNIIITFTGSITTWTIKKTVLSQILNINSSGTALSFTSPYSYNLNYDTYVLMSFDNIPSIFSSTSNLRSAFKISLSTNYGNINNFFSHRNNNEQSLILNDFNYIITNFKVIFYDRYGYAINNYNVDYSFTLSLIYEQ
jgi:hypothetical protein